MAVGGGGGVRRGELGRGLEMQLTEGENKVRLTPALLEVKCAEINS